jgi:uncharacterized protein YbcV (DUF1398 family)
MPACVEDVPAVSLIELQAVKRIVPTAAVFGKTCITDVVTKHYHMSYDFNKYISDEQGNVIKKASV